MAEFFTEVMQANTCPANSSLSRPQSSPEGVAIAYASMILMAVFPIIVAAFRTVTSRQLVINVGHTKDEDGPITMTMKKAAMYPIAVSVTLLIIYFYNVNVTQLSVPTSSLFNDNKASSFKNLMAICFFDTIYTYVFYYSMELVLTNLLSPVAFRLMSVVAQPKILFWYNRGTAPHVQQHSYTSHHLVCSFLYAVICVWYDIEKHWIASNLLGIAGAVYGIEKLIHLNDIATGCTLLGGLFFYDIFWVYGTNVMETVITSVDAPIKLVFPSDLLQNGLVAKSFVMIGLGDIVFPGIFIALLLRFDDSLKRGTNFYFNATTAAYTIGLVITILVGHVYCQLQPALLFLVPACIGVPLLLALVRGDLKTMLSFKDHPAEKFPKVMSFDGEISDD